MPTPNHSEYPTAHARVAGALAEVLHRYFGTKKVGFTFNSAATGTEHHFAATDDFVRESMEARIWGGMHYRTSTVRGKVLGTKVAHWVTRRHFRPVARGR